MNDAKDTLVSAYQAMKKVIDKHGLDVRFYGWDYSGRGMYGAITPAFYGDHNEIGTVATLAGKALGQRASSDSYALDGIVYFTGYSVERKDLSDSDWEALEAIDNSDEE